MTRHLLLSTIVIGSIAWAGPAVAGDYDAPPELRSSTFDIYVGAFGANNTIRSKSSAGTEDDGTLYSGSLNGEQYGFGLRAGADYRLGNWALGAVADWTFGGEIAQNDVNNSKLDMSGLGTLRARAGAQLGNGLLYVTGGLAGAELEYNVNNADLEIDGSNSGWSSGWAIGAGLDYALTDAISVNAEYLYIDLADMDYNLGEGVKVKQNIQSVQTVRVGIDYNFSM